jgi:glucose/arabinose dehydrogenase
MNATRTATVRRHGAHPVPLRIAAAATVAVLASTRPAVAQHAVPTDFQDHSVVTGLDQPVGMAFLPDGRLLVVERSTARVRLIVGGAVAATDPILTVPDVNAAYGERGLLGVAVDPGWPVRPYVYVQHCRLSSVHIAIARYTAVGDLAFASDGGFVLDPASRFDIVNDLLDDEEIHNGGTLRFGAGGMLLSSLGDDGDHCDALNPTKLVGKILRLDVSGLPPGPGGPALRAHITPADNPLAAHPDSNARLVYAYGLRNPFRFAVDAVSGALLVGDVGADEAEEVDWIEAGGGSYGWPVREGTVQQPYACAGVDTVGHLSPIAEYPHVAGGYAVIAGVVYRAPAAAAYAFPPEYEGDLFYGDFYEAFLRRLTWNGSAWIPETAPGQPNATDWWQGNGLVSDYAVGPDGALWYCQMFTGGGPGQIRTVRYVGSVTVPGPVRLAAGLEAPRPSPSSGAVEFAIALERGARLDVVVLDATGRLVGTLARGTPLGPGRHTWTWNGTLDRGVVAPPGLYFVRVHDGSASAVRRFVRLR